MLVKWEMLYTDSKVDEDLVDQVSIDMENKRYVLDIDADMCITDDTDENGEPFACSYYVSRKLFDFIITALNEQGFKYADWKDVE